MMDEGIATTAMKSQSMELSSAASSLDDTTPCEISIEFQRCRTCSGNRTTSAYS